MLFATFIKIHFLLGFFNEFFIFRKTTFSAKMNPEFLASLSLFDFLLAHDAFFLRIENFSKHIFLFYPGLKCLIAVRMSVCATPSLVSVWRNAQRLVRTKARLKPFNYHLGKERQYNDSQNDHRRCGNNLHILAFRFLHLFKPIDNRLVCGKKKYYDQRQNERDVIENEI